MKRIMQRVAFAAAVLAGSAPVQADMYSANYGSISSGGALVLSTPAVASNFAPTMFNTFTLTPAATSLPGGSASSGVSGSLYYNGNGANGSFSESDSNAAGDTVSVALERKGFGYAAEADAGAGRARLDLATKTGSNAGIYGNSSASGNASWTEWFVISGGTGTGTASFDSLLRGDLKSVAGGSLSYSVNLTYSTGSYCYWWYSSCSPADYDQTLTSLSGSFSGRSGIETSQTIAGEFEFAYDKPFMLTATLNASVANGARADLALDALGQSLSLPVGARLASASGVFAQPVPEAETWAMMLAGLGLVGLVAARRRV